MPRIGRRARGVAHVVLAWKEMARNIAGGVLDSLARILTARPEGSCEAAGVAMARHPVSIVRGQAVKVGETRGSFATANYTRIFSNRVRVCGSSERPIRPPAADLPRNKQKGARSLVALGWIARAVRPRAESQ